MENRPFYTPDEIGRIMVWHMSSVRPCCGFVHQSLASMHAEGSINISPWFSKFINDSITLDMLLENDGNFGEIINGTDIRPDLTHLS